MCSLEEDKSWDLDKRHEKEIVADFKWGDNEDKGAAGDNNEEDEADIAGGEMENSSLNELNEEGTTSTNEGRNRRPPDWMRDFVSGEGISKEEE